MQYIKITMTGNSKLILRLKRTAGWCEAVEEASRTHLGVADRNLFESRLGRNFRR
jgi:hypothetical protein